MRANLSYGELVTPKSGRVRVVPMVDEVAQQLARLAPGPTRPATTIRSLSRCSAAGLTQARCAAAMWRRQDGQDSERFRSTRCATSSVPSPSTGRPLCKSKPGWAIPISRRPRDTCTTERSAATLICSRSPSPWTRASRIAWRQARPRRGAWRPLDGDLVHSRAHPAPSPRFRRRLLAAVPIRRPPPVRYGAPSIARTGGRRPGSCGKACHWRRTRPPFG